jgi:CHAT domain
MMLTGGRATARDQPRVLQIQISRYTPKLPAPDENLRFLVAFHVEGSPTTWQRNAELSRAAEERVLSQIAGLRLWSARLGMSRRTAKAATESLGRTLRDVFLGRRGIELIERFDPTAVLLFVDETVIHLPWEFMCRGDGRPLFLTPFSRVVTSRVVPEPGRDPSVEDPEIRILAVENPTEDLVATERVVDVIQGLQGDRGDATVEVTVLEAKKATRRGFQRAVKGKAFDIIHFAGHGEFDPAKPADVALVLNDGPFVDEDVLALGWSAPPFVVFNSSCEGGRAAPGRRIVLGRTRSNGLAAAFLARGVDAYLAHYFLVPDASAAQFAEDFYEGLFAINNVGQAVQQARRSILDRYVSDGDLTAFGLTFIGDSGTAERADLATAT